MENIKKIDESHIEIDGIIYEKKETTQENKLPKSWRNFCDANKSIEDTYFIGSGSEIVRRATICCEYRDPSTDKNLLPSKELAKAMLALCQLIQLRECYNQGWEPNWRDNENKYCIELYKGVIIESVNICTQHVLSFKTNEISLNFLNNFKDLIEIAKPLL